MESITADDRATVRAALSDADVVRRVRAGETSLFEILMRRHNQRIYRVARSVLGSESEVEDVMQQAYLNAFLHLHQFEERSRFSTWLTRIALNEAFSRRRRQRGSEFLSDGMPDPEDEREGIMDKIRSPRPDPERQAYAGELHRVLEQAVDALPELYRTVFMMRDIEGLSTAETGDALGVGDDVVKTRLHRARALVRRQVSTRIGATAPAAFEFYAPRCNRVVAAVLAAIESAIFRPM